MKYYLGTQIFRVNQMVTLEKDENNVVDMEAIKVVFEGGEIVGYVANSVYTKALGTSSAGYIYRDFEKSITAKICFILHNAVIAQVIMPDAENKGEGSF